mgnify:CR=1 FL=1
MQITVVRGPAKGRTYLLGPMRVVLGRDEAADVQLGDPRVSRRHAEIRPGDGRSWILQDLDSTNQTFLNGQRIRQSELREGDEIILGDTHLSVQKAMASSDGAEVLSMRIDAESLRQTLGDSGDWNAGGKRLQEALFQIGLFADPSLEREQIVRNAIPIFEEGVPFVKWAWLRWPDGLEQPYVAIGERDGQSLDDKSLDPLESLIRRAVRGRRGVVSFERVPTGDGASPSQSMSVSGMAVPLLSRGEDDSVLYLERDFRFPPFRGEELAWVAALASQLTGHLETARLFGSLQGAHERLRATQSQVNRIEKLALIGRLSSSFAHDLNNPLTSLLGFLELCRRQAALVELEGKIPDYLERAQNAADYCRALCRNLLAVARQRPFSEGEMRPISVTETIERTLEICSSALQGIGAEVEIDLADKIPLEGDASTLQQIVMNLVVNAADALAELPSDCERKIRISARDGEKGVILEVSDNGPGIAPEILSSIFEPMVTSKDDTHGTGLGLYVVARIVEEAGGTIEVESTPGEGTTFRLTMGTRLNRLSSDEFDPASIPGDVYEEYS